MKYRVGQTLYATLGAATARIVLAVRPAAGMWTMPHYQFASDETRSGTVWTPEWMLSEEAGR